MMFEENKKASIDAAAGKTHVSASFMTGDEETSVRKTDKQKRKSYCHLSNCHKPKHTYGMVATNTTGAACLMTTRHQNK
eukprot:11755566-Ditylum_brightwellii.AAC.1